MYIIDVLDVAIGMLPPSVTWVLFPVTIHT